MSVNFYTFPNVDDVGVSVCLDVAGCLLSELESAGEVELFCSLNCRETADNAAAAGYQLPAAAAPVS